MKKQNILFWSLAGLILAIGIFVRYWQLDSIPPGIQYDEAYNGINAIQSLETGQFKVFYPENFGREGFHLNVTALYVKIFGTENFSLRLANAMWGSLTVIGFFFLLRALKLSRLSVLMGTLMIATSFWHLNFSRTAYRAIMVPMLLTWLSFFFFKGLSEKNSCKKYLYFALSGMATGLGFHTYIAFRVAPLIVIILTFFLFLTKKQFLQRYWKSALVYIFAAFIVMLPIIAYFLSHQDDLTKRAGDVSVMNEEYVKAKFNLTPAQALAKSFTTHIGAFFVHGDPNQRHNHNGQPIIPLAWSVLLVLGFVISLKEIFQSAYNYFKRRKEKDAKVATRLLYPSVLAQSIFWAMLIPGVLSIEGIPHALRIIGVIPGAFLLAALPFEYVYQLYRRLQTSETLALKPWRWNILRVSMAGIIAIVAVAGAMQIVLYFNVWAKDPKTLGAFERKLFDLGLLIKQLPPKTHNYIITTQSIAVSADHKQSSLKTAEYLGYPNIKQYEFYHPLDGRFDTKCEDSQIVFQEADVWLIDQFKQQCPNLKEEQIVPEKGIYPMWVLR